MDETEFLSAHTASLSPLARARALAARDDAIADAADGRAKTAQEAAAGHRVETLTLANRQAGDPLGRLQRFRVECAAADDEVRDLADKLEKATARRDRIQGSIESLSRSVHEMTASVSRSAPVDLLAPAKEALREHAEYVARSRQLWQAAQNGTSAPPPFGGRGVIARNEPVTCDACLAMGASPAESFVIHHMDADGNPLAASPDVPVRVPPDDVDRAERGFDPYTDWLPCRDCGVPANRCVCPVVVR